MQSGDMHMQSGGKGINLENTNYDDKSADNNNNYPGSLETSQNSIPVGKTSTRQNTGFEAGIDYIDAYEGVKFMEQSSEGGTNTSVWGSNPANITMSGGADPHASTCTDAAEEPESILAYKEITIDTEKQADSQTGSGSHEGKKTVNISL